MFNYISPETSSIIMGFLSGVLVGMLVFFILELVRFIDIDMGADEEMIERIRRGGP